jgi:hypothetical protein
MLVLEKLLEQGDHFWKSQGKPGKVSEFGGTWKSRGFLKNID